MKCPHCGNKTIVINSRPVGDGVIRRRHACPACSERFSTIETLIHEPWKCETPTGDDPQTYFAMLEKIIAESGRIIETLKELVKGEKQ